MVELSPQRALELLADTSATKVTLPFVDELLRSARRLVGEDFWPYGVEPNRQTLDRLLGYHHAQGLSSRRLAIEDKFHPVDPSNIQNLEILIACWCGSPMQISIGFQSSTSFGACGQNPSRTTLPIDRPLSIS